MKIRPPGRFPTLKNIVQTAHKNGATANRFRVTPEEAERIRKAEAAGGHDRGLRMVLAILREKNQTSTR